MIKSFRHKGLQELWSVGRTSKIDGKLHSRILRRLNSMDRVTQIESLRVPGFDFHALHGFTPTRYSIHVNGPWCLTFEVLDGDVLRVDFEQYH